MGLRMPYRLEPVASVAVPDVEVVADDWKHHWMFAIQEAAVFNRLIADLRQDIWRPPPVPAKTMRGFWLHNGLRTTDY